MSNLFDVYDLFYPSPTTLKEIAVIKVAIELWRQEIIKHRTSGTLDKLTFTDNISSSVLNSQAPAVILPIIDEYIGHIKVSINGWLDYHTFLNKFFDSSILQNFDDFVGDFGGAIHYRKTAQRIVVCDGVGQVQRFKIACLYCLEKDIEQLWPSVSSEIDLNEINISKYPQLFYWICRLRNQLYKIPMPRTLRNNIDGAMLFRINYSGHRHWSAIEYFLNRLDSSRQMCCVKNIFKSEQQLFYRYVLAKLSKEELDEFLITNRSALWSFIYQNMGADSNNVTAVWNYINSKSDENDFVTLFQQILARPPSSKPAVNKPTPYLEIWTNAPDNYKQSAIQRVLLADSLFRSDGRYGEAPAKHLTMVTAALSEASAEDRSIFWNKHWCDLMMALNIGDFRQLMTLCFKDEDEINRYKETVMCDYEKIGRFCLKLFSSANFEKLDEFLNFLCAGEQNLRIIRSYVLSENFGINGEHLKKASALNDFINGAFEDPDGAAEFKNRLLLKPTNVKNFESFVTNGMLKSVREFIDEVIPSEEAVREFKKQCMVPIFRQYLTYGTFLKQSDEEYLGFLRWCAGESEDEIAGFKQTLLVDEVVQEVIRQEMQGKSKKSADSSGRTFMTYYSKLVEFLKWYFVSIEAYEEFLAKYAEDDVFVKLTTESKQSEKDEKSEENERGEKMEQSDQVEQPQGNEQLEQNQQPEQVQGEQNAQPEQVQGEQNAQPEQVQGEQNAQPEQVQGEQNVQPEQVQGEQNVQPQQIQDEPMMVD